MKAVNRAALEEVLEMFDTVKVSELAEDDYDEFMEECDKAIDGADAK